MTSPGLGVLGSLARMMRSAGLGSVLSASIGCVDALSIAFDVPLLSAQIGGIRLRGFARHRSFLEHVASGTYEPYTLELFRSALGPGSLVIDAGAHIGLFSATACAALGKNGEVIAIEPDPYNFRALEINLRRCGCVHARTIRAAVWRARGEMEFFVSPGTIGSSLVARPNLGRVKAIRTPTVSIDDVATVDPQRRVIVKLDLEGAEIEALEGMKELLERAGHVVLLVEVNPGAQAEAGHSDTTLIRALRAAGLRVAFAEEFERRLAEVGEHAPRKGILFCTRGKEA